IVSTRHGLGHRLPQMFPSSERANHTNPVAQSQNLLIDVGPAAINWRNDKRRPVSGAFRRLEEAGRETPIPPIGERPDFVSLALWVLALWPGRLRSVPG